MMRSPPNVSSTMLMVSLQSDCASVLCATAGYVGLADVGVGSLDCHIDVGSCLGSGIDGCDELRAAVGIDGMVAAVVGNEDTPERVALGNANGNGEHDAVAEGHHGGFHVGVGIVTVGNGVGTLKERAFEILLHEGEGDDNVAYAEALAVEPGERNLAGVVVRHVLGETCHVY